MPYYHLNLALDNGWNRPSSRIITHLAFLQPAGQCMEPLRRRRIVSRTVSGRQPTIFRRASGPTSPRRAA